MSEEKLTAYCVKCKEKRDMQDPEAVYTATGTPGTRGRCAVCDTRLFKMGRTPAHENVPKPEVTAKPKRKKTTAKTKTKKSKAAPRRRGKLVIVESPTKARTIGKFLGKGYTVKSSVGHIRDLLKSQLSVDVENDFTPKYRVPNEKRPLLKELKQDAAKSVEIYLATDADREGEAIAWHLMEAIEADPARTKRVVFHEITKDAIDQAFSNPREIDMNRVNAQQARRILDRLVGYKISPLLWRRVRSRTSAGRVQSVALRLINEREEEIDQFIPVEYWTIDVSLNKQPPEEVNGSGSSTPSETFTARLLKANGVDVELTNQEQTEKIVADLAQLPYQVSQVKRGQRRRNPSAPFITSTMQQEASRRLGFGTRKTMSIAQQLYEGVDLGEGETVGLITYMRTDSTTISEQAQTEARRLIAEQYGDDYLPETPPQYRSSNARAQEAHEAVRPTEAWRSPAMVKTYLSRDQYRLYNLIWSRFIASQMNPALYETMRVDIDAGSYALRATGSRIIFQGFLSVYQESRDEDAASSDDKRMLPDLADGESLTLDNVLPAQHFTQPPPRYSEASLVKSLEEFGIGRPSTYAPTISTIQQRGYVELDDKRFYPTDLGKIVNELLIDYFPDVVDVEFTARMEENLDQIAWQEKDWVPVLQKFYTPFEKTVAEAEAKMPKVELVEEPIGEQCEECGGELIIRYGRYGKFIGCANFPECRYTRPFVQKLGICCPACQTGEIIERKTKKGRTFFGCSTYPDCEWTSWKRPLTKPCPDCGGLLVVQSKKQAMCLRCENRFDLDSILDEQAQTAEAESLPVAATA